MGRKTRALTLVEALIFLGIIMLLTVIIIPQVQGARISTNENEAIKTLKLLWEKASKIKNKNPKAFKIRDVVEEVKSSNPDIRIVEESKKDGFGIVFHHGYLFYLWSSPQEDGTLIGYGWPAEIESSGISTFFINNEGKIYFCRNLRERYSGSELRPDINAAFPMPTHKENKEAKNAVSYLGQDYQWWTLIKESA